jgi:hypothetical protein
MVTRGLSLDRFQRLLAGFPYGTSTRAAFRSQCAVCWEHPGVRGRPMDLCPALKGVSASKHARVTLAIAVTSETLLISDAYRNQISLLV